MTLPPLLPWQTVRQRLQTIFPGGVPERQFLVREVTARTVFVALYVGAVEGAERWIAPLMQLHDGITASRKLSALL